MTTVRGLVFVFLAVLTLVAVRVGAETEESDDTFFQAIGRSPADQGHRSRAKEDRDDQPLEIQAALPQPSRSPDGRNVPSADDEERDETPPASD